MNRRRDGREAGSMFKFKDRRKSDCRAALTLVFPALTESRGALIELHALLPRPHGIMMMKDRLRKPFVRSSCAWLNC
jgi:hypothetical protein